VRQTIQTSLRLRFLIFSLSISILIAASIILVLHLYRADHTTDKITIELRNLAVLNASFLYDAEQAGADAQMHDILRSFSAFSDVICASYLDGEAGLLASWPREGCDYAEMPASVKPMRLAFDLPLAQSRQITVSIDQTISDMDLRQETLIFGGLVLSIVLIIFLVISRQFERVVLKPLDSMNAAMLASTPDVPVLAKSAYEDEIGRIIKTYNRMAASARRYVRRLRISEHEVRLSETRFRDMAEISSDWYFEMDAELRFTMISDGFFEKIKRDPSELMGSRRDELAGYGVSSSNWQSHISDLQNRREFRNFEYSILQDDGTAKHISISGMPQFDKDGIFTGYRGVGSDVTLIKENEWQLAETNRNFGESVTYAANIQRALLPTKDILEARLGKVSTIWQPKDLVGGDFYWSGTISGVDYLVFFDCTGHGVPGAFMTLIVTSVIERIALSAPTALPADKLLRRIHIGVCDALGVTDDKSGKDGLDCAVIKLNRFEDSLEFSGASIDLYAVSETGDVTRHRGSRASLGYDRKAQGLTGEKIKISIGANSFVLSTDGMLTQVGAETRRVMGNRRFAQALEEAKTNDPAKLVRALARALKQWQGAEERRDDVSLLAFKPSDAKQDIDASIFG